MKPQRKTGLMTWGIVIFFLVMLIALILEGIKDYFEWILLIVDLAVLGYYASQIWKNSHPK